MNPVNPPPVPLPGAPSRQDLRKAFLAAQGRWPSEWFFCARLRRRFKRKARLDDFAHICHTPTDRGLLLVPRSGHDALDTSGAIMDFKHAKQVLAKVFLLEVWRHPNWSPSQPDGIVAVARVDAPTGGAQ